MISRIAPGLFDPRDQRKLNRAFSKLSGSSEIFNDPGFEPNTFKDNLRSDLNAIVPGVATSSLNALHEHRVIPEVFVADRLRDRTKQHEVVRFLSLKRFSQTPRLLLLNADAPALIPEFIRASTLMLLSHEGEFNISHPTKAYDDDYARIFESSGETLPLFAARRVILSGDVADFGTLTRTLILSGLQHGLKQLEFVVIKDLTTRDGNFVEETNEMDLVATRWIFELGDRRIATFSSRREGPAADLAFVIKRDGRSMKLKIRMSSSRDPEWKRSAAAAATP